MSVGAFLDRATATLTRALAQVQALPEPTGYDAAATIAARDNLYRQLTRLCDLTAAAGRTGPASPAVSDAATRLGSVTGRHRPAATVLSTVLADATLNVAQPARELLTAAGTAAAGLQEAADMLAMAAEIVATHHRPPGSPSRYMTAEAEALGRGARRVETIGEIARLAAQAMQLDTHLATWRAHHPHVIAAGQWDVLAQWRPSGFPTAVAQLGATRPAALLRALTPAVASERPGGPREITSWTEAIDTVQAIRAALRRDRTLGVAALAAATARVGFAVSAAGWRLSGRQTPLPATAERGRRWHALAKAMAQVADTRDALARTYVAELDRAKRWIKQRLAGHTGRANNAEAQQFLLMERQVDLLCQDLAEPMRRARADGHLLTATTVMNTVATAGIVLPTLEWSEPAASGGPMLTAMKALNAAADPLPPLSLRTTLDDLLSADSGPGHITRPAAAAWISPTVSPQLPANQSTSTQPVGRVSAVASAFRAPITEALLRATRQAPPPGAAHRPDEKGQALER